MLNYPATAWTSFVILTTNVKFLTLRIGQFVFPPDKVVYVTSGQSVICTRSDMMDALGMSKNYWFYSKNTMCNILGEQKSQAISVFLVLTLLLFLRKRAKSQLGRHGKSMKK